MSLPPDRGRQRSTLAETGSEAARNSKIQSRNRFQQILAKAGEPFRRTVKLPKTDTMESVVLHFPMMLTLR